MTKKIKGHKEFWRKKIGFFLKRPNRENFGRSKRNFSEIGGNMKQGGNASLPQEGWTPLAIFIRQNFV